MAENLDLDIKDIEKEEIDFNYKPESKEEEDPEQISHHSPGAADNLSDAEAESKKDPEPKEPIARVPKPLSPYVLFMKALKDDAEFQAYLEANNKLKKNFLEEASKRWKELSSEAKKPYEKESQRMKEQYELYE